MLRLTLVMLGTLMLCRFASAAHHHHHHPHGEMSDEAETIEHHNAPHVHEDPDGTVHLTHRQNYLTSADKDEGETWATHHFPSQMDSKFYCPKEFVPGRPGGFLDRARSKHAACWTKVLLLWK